MAPSVYVGSETGKRCVFPGLRIRQGREVWLITITLYNSSAQDLKNGLSRREDQFLNKERSDVEAS